MKAALVLALFFLFGCAQVEEPTPEGSAFLELDILPRNARLYLPQETKAASYRLSGLGPGGLEAAAESKYPSFSIELAPGAWKLTVEGLSTMGCAILRGALELVLGPGERRSATLALLPLEGEGSFSLSWSIQGEPGPGCRVEGRLSAEGGLELPLSAAAELGLISIPSLPAASYALELGLFGSEGRLCGMADSVLVLSGFETSAAVLFSPPEASLSLAIAEPVFVGPELAIQPLRRRARLGLEVAFSLPEWAGPGTWFLEGEPRLEAGSELRLSLGESGRRRIDWVGQSTGLALAVGSAELRASEGARLGPLEWAESLGRIDIEASAASRSLDDCRDLAFSPDGSLLAALGKEGSSIGLFAFPGPGRLSPLGGLGKSELPSLEASSRLRFLPSGEGLLALSEGVGALYYLELGAEGRELILAAEARGAELIGASDLAVSPDGLHAYVVSPAAEAILLIAAESGPSSLIRVAGAGETGLELLSRPLSLALSPEGTLLALGTGGDDAIYLFHRDGSSGSLTFFQRVSKESLSAFASLSDPLALAFSPDARSLFALSYYGKALIRLDQDAGSGLFQPSAAAKSGASGVFGFDYPKRLALSPDGSLLLVTASGATDGLSAFAVGEAGRLDFLGSLTPDGSDSRLGKPYPLAFSPGGESLIVASAEEDRLAIYDTIP